jgi:hypothetical protein
MTHVDELLARSLEEGLSPAEDVHVREHVRSCAQCSALANDLRQNDARLAAPQAQIALDPLPIPAPARNQGKRLALAGLLAILVLVLLVSITATVVPAGPSAASPSPGAGLPSPYLITAHRLVTDTVPGGGAVVTQAFDSFHVVSSTGVARDSTINGVGVGRPAFDDVSRVAYWARTSLTSGAYRLTVWDATSQQERVMLTLGSEGIAGDPLWTADGRSLIVSIRTAAGDRVRLTRIDATTAAVTLVSETSPADAVGAIYADDAIIVGLRAQAYVVLDARSGKQSTETPMRQPRAAEFIASRSGVVLELVRPFEAESGPLRIWRVSNPGAVLATIDERGITTPLYWPATGEVAYARGHTMYAFNPTAGTTRVLAVLAPQLEAPWLVGFNSSGDSLIFRSGDRFKALKVLPPRDPPVFDDLQVGRPEDLGFVLNPSLYEAIGVGP